MMHEEDYVELRLPCPGAVYVAVLGQRCPVFGFERLFNQFRVGRVRRPDGSKEEVHRLPCQDLIHEIAEMQDGQPRRRYVATIKGSYVLHPISRFGAEVFARREMPLNEVILRYPERPLIEVEDD